MGQGKELGVGLFQGLPPNTLKTISTYIHSMHLRGDSLDHFLQLVFS
jgi:hypothetical protein